MFTLFQSYTQHMFTIFRATLNTCLPFSELHQTHVYLFQSYTQHIAYLLQSYTKHIAYLFQSYTQNIIAYLF